MPRHKTIPSAYKLLHEGMEALAVVSENGLRIDKGYLDTAIADGERQVAEMVREIANAPEAAVWRRRFREKTNYLAPAQMAAVVFGDLGFKAPYRTARGRRDAADEKAFAHVNLPFVRTLFEAKKVKNAVDTFLTGIRREAVLHRDGCWYVHPNYGLNTTITYRSSSDSPNLHNQPNRNPVMARMVRQTYIPRPGNQIVEIDLGQQEARIMCPVTGDPALIAYISDPKSDMHRDMAAQIYKCHPDLVSKALRGLVKAGYVFSTFYGSYWAQTAVSLWEGIDEPAAPIKLADGIPVRDHLTALGFLDLGEVDGNDPDPAPGTWAAYIRDIDRHFWGTRFPHYAQWKKDTFAEYLRDGGFQMLTGFAVNLPLNRKQVCNSKVQGPAFHVLLRALPLMNEWLARYRFRSRVICEIHDAVQFDCPPDERDDVIDMAIHYLTVDARKAWPWISVPLVCEAEVCPMDQSWYDKVQVIKATETGLWRPADETKWAAKYGDWALQCLA